MSKRISRSPADPAARRAGDCRDRKACVCCAAIRRAQARSLFDPLPEWRSPLTPGVQGVNLSCSMDGLSIYTELGRDWPRMFAHLTAVGAGMVMTHNLAAVVARKMPYPALTVTSSGLKAASGAGGLCVNFAQLGSARAMHLRRAGRHIFGVEFCDLEGRLVHRFTPTAENVGDAFFDWVRLHQACSAEQHFWIDEGDDVFPDEGAPARRRLTDAGAMASTLAVCAERAIAVNATVVSVGIRQRATFTPLSIQRDGDWWFVSDDDAGLHFHPLLLSSAEVIRSGDAMALRCGLADDVDGWLTLEAAPETPTEQWTEALQTLL